MLILVTSKGVNGNFTLISRGDFFFYIPVKRFGWLLFPSKIIMYPSVVRTIGVQYSIAFSNARGRR